MNLIFRPLMPPASFTLRNTAAAACEPGLPMRDSGPDSGKIPPTTMSPPPGTAAPGAGAGAGAPGRGAAPGAGSAPAGRAAAGPAGGLADGAAPRAVCADGSARLAAVAGVPDPPPAGVVPVVGAAAGSDADPVTSSAGAVV